MKRIMAGMVVATLFAAAGCKKTIVVQQDDPWDAPREMSGDPPESARMDPPPKKAGDYMPAEYYLAFEAGRVPENWVPCLMTEPAAGASGEAGMTDVRTKHKFFTAKFMRTRPAMASDIKIGAKVFVLVQWGVAARLGGSAARNFRSTEHEWLETTVTGTQGLDSGLFQAPHRETGDIHISNARVDLAAVAPVKAPDSAPKAADDYMPAEYYLAFEVGRVPEHWVPCIMTAEATGDSREAEMTDVRNNHKFRTTKYVRTRPAKTSDIKVGAKVYVLVQWAVAVRESGSAARNFKDDSFEWLEASVTGTQGLDSGLFQAPHREKNDIHLSNARVAE